MKIFKGETFTCTIKIHKDEWEAIQASFHIDLREEDPCYNEEVINRYDFRAGTNPANFTFEFADGTKIFLGWYVEEFGGVVEWGDEELNTLDSGYELATRTEFIDNESGNVYVCAFEVLDY